MHNFGYSESATSDERVVVDCYCFLIAICSHHLVVSLALTPVAVLGWDSAGSAGKFLFYAGAVSDVAYSAYDSIQTTLRTFLPVSFKCLGVQLPKKYFIVIVCLHHTLSMLLTVPMILYYPTMRALQRFDVVNALCCRRRLFARLLQVHPGHARLSPGLLAIQGRSIPGSPHTVSSKSSVSVSTVSLVLD